MFTLLGGERKKKWTTLVHNGPMFPPLYEPHNIPISYINPINGETQKVYLNPKAEEIATLYAKILGHEILENKTFQKNFWKDWKETLGSDSPIKELRNCDFYEINRYYLNQKNILINLKPEEKEKIKKKKEAIEEKYQYCIIDGKKEKVGNFKIEPPGIFMGRGNNPNLGKIKRRINPEDVIINIGKEAPIPDTPSPNSDWKEVIHDETAIWLSSWKDTITRKNKYIFTSHEAGFKSKSDEKKFNRARELKKIIKKIHLNNNKNIDSTDEKTRQLATALYLIDNLALRVGSSKNKKETADTVGVTSLRVEHLKLLENNYIKLDFLGKDSIRYCNKVKVSQEIYRNLKEFQKDKARKDQLFNLINSQTLNEYLKSFMPKLTSKVFRTYNASETFQKGLNKIESEKMEKLSEGERINFLLELINQANAEVAILCNHQKAISSSFKNQIEKMDERIKKSKKLLKKAKTSKSKSKKERIEKIKKKIKLMQIKKKTKLKMKNVSLGTSKNNYIDPRIIIAFMKKYNIPVDKIFNKTLENRFDWAMNIENDFNF
ncbi:Eukaryotic DNA topoisomerase I, catalytic core [seawater metagenome]|uniref:DNA topoisomerase 1 n=1 Tax=seawater metagenome TaxID=1561972 RepID=A0A5E8CHV9_9ZZZZ